jgi:hypothetical protein
MVGLVLVACEPEVPIELLPTGVAGVGEEPATGQGTLAVNLAPVEGLFVDGFDVTLRYLDADGDETGAIDWSQSVPPNASLDTYYKHVHNQAVPAGAVTLQSWVRTSPGGPVPPSSGPACTTDVAVGEGDLARVTLLLVPDPQSGECAAVTAATLEGDQVLAMPRGLPAPGFVGLNQVQAVAAAAARRWHIRVVARDGEAYFVTEDHVPQRVDLVIDHGVVLAAARG